MADKVTPDFLTYKGRPLVRKGDEIYYGSMADKYVILLKILSKKKQGEIEVADKVSVHLMYTDPDLKTRDRVVKKSEKNNFYDAIDIGSIWLERALAE